MSQSEIVLPAPDLTPQQVVRIQLDAMRRNDDPLPNSGIELAFRFASPANKVHTGPLSRFAQMVKGPLYASLLDYCAVELGPLYTGDDQAQQMVRVRDRHGRTVTYIFGLSRQESGPFSGCWMTDSVLLGG